MAGFVTFYNIESGSLAVTVELYVSSEIAFHTKWAYHAVGKYWRAWSVQFDIGAHSGVCGIVYNVHSHPCVYDELDWGMEDYARTTGDFEGCLFDTVNTLSSLKVPDSLFTSSSAGLEARCLTLCCKDDSHTLAKCSVLKHF